MPTDVIAKRPLPAPTRDFARAFEDLAQFGYAIIADALEPAQVAALRGRVVAQARGEVARGVAYHDYKANQRIWMLLNKGRIFRDVTLHPLVEQFMRPILGEDFLLSSFTANIARPGSPPMSLHFDQYYVDFWTAKPLVANIAWMLDDFTDANGGTRLVPGSHMDNERRTYGIEDTVAAVAPAGSALIFDGRLVHGTGANVTADEERHVLLSYHCRPFLRQQENFYWGLDPKIRRTEREVFLRRLGFAIWATMGRTHDPDQPGMLEPLETPIGALDDEGRPLADA